MKKLFIPIIFARAKEKRVSYTEKVVPVVVEFAKAAGLETELIDTRTSGINDTSRELLTPEKKKLSVILNSADGFIIVSPEYNFSFPGELKIFLDSFYDEYNRKPCGIVAVSSGGIGGARMVEQLRLVVIALQMVAIRPSVSFSTVKKLFDENGVFLEAQKDVYAERFQKFFAELIWYAAALQKARGK